MNALPPARWTSSSTRVCSGGRPRIASAWTATSSRPKRPRSRTSTVGTRESSAIHGSRGWRRCSSSLRYVSTIAPGQPRLRTRYPIRSSDAGSAQWRSSNTTTSGRPSAARWRSVRTASNTRPGMRPSGTDGGLATQMGAQGGRDAHEIGADAIEEGVGGGRVARPQDGLGGRHDRGEWQWGVDEGRAPTDHELEAAARGLDAQLQHEPGLADPRPHREPPPSRYPRRRRVPRRPGAPRAPRCGRR